MPARPVAVLLLLTLLGACAKKGSDDASPVKSDARKVIQTGRIELTVAKYEDTRAQLEATIAAAGGYIDTTQVVHRQGAVSDAKVVVRIPAKQFTAMVARVRELGDVESESTDAVDVTEQYIDVAARIASAQVLEKRLLELAAEKTGALDAVLTVEKELARVRGEIEGHQGRMRVWDMSTLTLDIRSRAPGLAASESPGLGERIGRTFHDSVDALGTALSSLAVLITALAPWLLVGSPFLAGYVVWRRRRRA